MTTIEIEVAVARFFDIRRNLIVPNVSWGLGFTHECDLLVVTKSGYANEIEIKTGLYDLKRDGLKRHGHRSKKIRRLFFAFSPELLGPALRFVREDAGLMVVEKNRVIVNRPAVINKEARPLTNEEICHLGRLASMRIWGLKEALVNRIRGMKEEAIVSWEDGAGWY